MTSIALVLIFSAIILYAREVEREEQIKERMKKGK